jgi:hypothetical protein
MPVSASGGGWRAGGVRIGMVLAALALLSGCKDQKRGTDPSVGGVGVAREAAEQNIRAGAGSSKQMSFRGVQVYAQASPQRMAVCGQVNPLPDDSTMFVPFVSIVSLPDSQATGVPQYKIEQYIGTTTSEASRVYLAIVNYCYDKGGPAAAGPLRSVMAMAPLPDSLPDPTARAMAPPPPAQSAPKVATDSMPASGTVIMRQNGNLHADPHGPTTRVVPQGTSLHVFAQALGGWYQVGDTAPWGWVHESVLERH